MSLIGRLNAIHASAAVTAFFVLGAFASSALAEKPYSFSLDFIENNKNVRYEQQMDKQWVPGTWEFEKLQFKKTAAVRGKFSSKNYVSEVIIALNGLPLRKTDQNFRSGYHVTIEYLDRNNAKYTIERDGKVKTKKMSGHNFVDPHSLPFYLRGYPFDSPKPIHFDVIHTTFGRTFAMEVIYKGREEIQLSDRKVLAHKLEMRSANRVIRLLAPEFYFWYTVDPPHHYVQFEGDGETDRLRSLDGYAKRAAARR